MTPSNKVLTKNKVAKPLDPLIYATARDFAATWFEAALSSGLKDIRYNKDPRAFAVRNLEKFIPLAIKILLDMLKPTSNCNELMRRRIYEAITNPINDPDLMEDAKKPLDSNAQMLQNAITAFNKNKVKFNINSTGTVLDNKVEKKNLKGSTSYG